MLLQCAFDDATSLENINSEALDMIEKHFNNNRALISNLPKCHGNAYMIQKEFKILPAHRIAMLNVPSLLRPTDNFPIHESFSTILKEFVETSINNFKKTPNNHRYSDIVFDFAMYIFIMGGRALYEVLSSNLPFPAVSTIRKPLNI